MKIKITILIMLVAFATISVTAQQKSIAVGAGLGLTRGINEGIPSERNLGLLFGVYGLFNNGFGNGLTPEFSLSFTSNGTGDASDVLLKGGYRSYETSYIVPELRLRYALSDGAWSPYVMAGVGVMMWDASKYQQLDGEASGATVTFPVGLGFTYELSNDWALDFNLGNNLTLSDDLNPAHDDVKDGNWFARLGVHYTVARFEKDTDGDGIPDKDEPKYGTDPTNPDTDNDGLLDGEEVNEYKTNPLDPDTDKGGIKDGVEVRNGADPLDADDDIMNIGSGEKLILKGIEFVTAKSDITPKSERILGFALKAMQKMPDVNFEVVGHTDDVGSRENNIKLSKERAESVKSWLVTRGIDASRLSTRGAGPDEPLVPNNSDENRQRNRRVEFIRK